MRQWFMKTLWYVDGALSNLDIIKLWSTDNIFKPVSVPFTTSKHHAPKVCLHHSLAVMCLLSFPKLNAVQVFLLGWGFRRGVWILCCNNFLTKYTLSWCVPAPGCGALWTCVFSGDNSQGVKGDSRIFQRDTGWRQPCLQGKQDLLLEVKEGAFQGPHRQYSGYY